MGGVLCGEDSSGDVVDHEQQQQQSSCWITCCHEICGEYPEYNTHPDAGLSPHHLAKPDDDDDNENVKENVKNSPEKQQQETSVNNNDNNKPPFESSVRRKSQSPTARASSPFRNPNAASTNSGSPFNEKNNIGEEQEEQEEENSKPKDLASSMKILLDSSVHKNKVEEYKAYLSPTRYPNMPEAVSPFVSEARRRSSATSPSGVTSPSVSPTPDHHHHHTKRDTESPVSSGVSEGSVRSVSDDEKVIETLKKSQQELLLEQQKQKQQHVKESSSNSTSRQRSRSPSPIDTKSATQIQDELLRASRQEAQKLRSSRVVSIHSPTEDPALGTAIWLQSKHQSTSRGGGQDHEIVVPPTAIIKTSASATSLDRMSSSSASSSKNIATYKTTTTDRHSPTGSDAAFLAAVKAQSPQGYSYYSSGGKKNTSTGYLLKKSFGKQISSPNQQQENQNASTPDRFGPAPFPRSNTSGSNLSDLAPPSSSSDRNRKETSPTHHPHFVPGSGGDSEADGSLEFDMNRDSDVGSDESSESSEDEFAVFEKEKQEGENEFLFGKTSQKQNNEEVNNKKKKHKSRRKNMYHRNITAPSFDDVYHDDDDDQKLSSPSSLRQLHDQQQNKQQQQSAFSAVSPKQQRKQRQQQQNDAGILSGMNIVNQLSDTKYSAADVPEITVQLVALRGFSFIQSQEREDRRIMFSSFLILQYEMILWKEASKMLRPFESLFNEMLYDRFMILREWDKLRNVTIRDARIEGREVDIVVSRRVASDSVAASQARREREEARYAPPRIFRAKMSALGASNQQSSIFGDPNSPSGTTNYLDTLKNSPLSPTSGSSRTTFAWLKQKQDKKRPPGLLDEPYASQITEEEHNARFINMNTSRQEALVLIDTYVNLGCFPLLGALPPQDRLPIVSRRAARETAEKWKLVEIEKRLEELAAAHHSQTTSYGQSLTPYAMATSELRLCHTDESDSRVTIIAGQDRYLAAIGRLFEAEYQVVKAHDGRRDMQRRTVALSVMLQTTRDESVSFLKRIGRGYLLRKHLAPVYHINLRGPSLRFLIRKCDWGRRQLVTEENTVFSHLVTFAATSSVNVLPEEQWPGLLPITRYLTESCETVEELMREILSKEQDEEMFEIETEALISMGNKVSRYLNDQRRRY